MRNIWISSVLALGAFFGSVQSDAFGITIFSPEHVALGDGATDAEHIAMAARPEFQAGGWFSYTNAATGQTTRNSAVLVSPNWVVTSQQNTLNLDTGGSLALSGMKIGFGSNALTDTTSYSVTQVIRPPGFSTNDFNNNLAFLRLATPVTDVAPVRLYTGNLSAGQEVAAIGHGQPGSQAAGLLPYDGLERGMVNQLRESDYMRVIFPWATNWLMTEFEAYPDTPTYEYFGGSVSPGDDGGGLFVLDGGEWKLAGLTMFDFNAPNYGAYSLYTDMTSYIDWIGAQSTLSFLVPEPAGLSSFLMVGTLAATKRRSRTKK